MNDKVKIGLLQCVYVGVIVAVMEIVWMLVSAAAESGFLWCMFAPLAICFLTGASTVKQCVALIINGLAGIFGGWLIFQLVDVMMSNGMGTIPAFVIGTVVIVFIWQYVTMTVLGDSGWGICPMTFVGMMICFAANVQNLFVASAGCVGGIISGVVMVLLCNLAVKQVTSKGEEKAE